MHSIGIIFKHYCRNVTAESDTLTYTQAQIQNLFTERGGEGKSLSRHYLIIQPKNSIDYCRRTHEPWPVLATAAFEFVIL